MDAEATDDGPEEETISSPAEGTVDTEADEMIDAEVIEVDGERGSESTIEDDLDLSVDLLVAMQTERDEYLQLAQRERAEYENARKRWDRERSAIVERAEERLASSLLAVLDTCDAAIEHGSEDVASIQSQLVGILTSAGLSRIDEADVPFDPNFHDAVMREDGDDDTQMVAAVLRPGYLWRGNLLRPAMVRVRG